MVVLLIPSCGAEFTPGDVNIYLWVDKTQYKPGDTVTLYMTIVNAKLSNIVVNETIIQCPWLMFIRDHWEGNYTFDINRVVKAGGNYSTSMTFPVPDDGRATEFGLSPAIKVLVEINGTFTDHTYTVNINIANPPVQTSIEGVDTIILLMAVLIILIVVCTALIAAAIFLSARKPQETYTQATSQR
jgi:hypothetical protein